MSKKLISFLIGLGVMAMSVFSVTNALALTVDNEMLKPVKGIPLTSALKLCKESTANLLTRIENEHATALSLHLSNEEMQRRIYVIKEYWRQVCTEAGVNYAKLRLR